MSKLIAVVALALVAVASGILQFTVFFFAETVFGWHFSNFCAHFRINSPCSAYAR